MRKDALYEIEACVKGRKGAITPTQIARATGIHFSSVNDVVEVLEKYGIVSISTNGRLKLVTYNYKKV